MTTTSAHRRAARSPAPPGAPTVVRVALYTRKSTEKGLDQAFNSIDAQRQMLEEFVVRHADEGWIALPERYDDGGFSGGNTNRPAFQRLLADVQAGRIDKVAVYRLDRLSRSTGDFVGILQHFKQHGIEAVSPNERIEHATASDRLNVGIRMQVSQFEREVAAERIRDKMRAARGQGLWQGGRPVLGYDVVAKRLVVNEVEAGDVVAVFETYLRTTSLVATLAELERRGIRNKSWTTLRGRSVHGSPFDANTLRSLLGNVLYVGQIHAGDQVAKGEQPAIVPEATWAAAQELLESARTERRRERQPTGALLQGLLRCGRCGGGMVAHYSVRRSRRYASYVCATMKRRGVTACPGSRAPLGPMEAFVVSQVAAIGRDPELVERVLEAAGTELLAMRAETAQDGRRAAIELRRAEQAGDGAGTAAAIRRAGKLAEEATALKTCTVNEDELRCALESFELVWTELFPAERLRLLHLLLVRIEYDTKTDRVALVFPTVDGESTIVQEVAFRRREGSGLVVRKRRTVATRASNDEAAPELAPAADAHPTALLLALAYRLERLVATGHLRDYREAAARFGISHARVSQVSAMLLLAPRIQADILLGRMAATEGRLRTAIRAADWTLQGRTLRPSPDSR